MQEDFLRYWAQRSPTRPAVIIDGGETRTFAELDRASAQIAAQLRAAGLIDGDVVAMLMPNATRTIELWWGVRRAGLYYVPLSTRLTADELAYLIDDSDACLLVAGDGLSDAAAGAIARSSRARAGLCHVVPAGLAGTAGLFGPESEPAKVIGREIIYSSGTTGRPKGIRRALLPADQACQLPPFETMLRANFELRENIRFLISSPLYHAMGRFANRAIEVGGTAVVLPRFEAEASLAAIERHGVTHSLWVPTMFGRMLALNPAVRARYDLSSHTFALHAAAPCRVSLKRAMIDWWGPIVHEFYGGSENAGVTFIRAEDWLDRPGTVGKALIGRVHVLDEDDGRELPAGETGMIYFEGGVPFTYIGGTPARTSAQGLGSYGDLGWVDDEGYLFISDRRDDLIIVGGVNVSPLEIEEVLSANPAVTDVAVVGIPHEDLGQQVVAVVVPALSKVPGIALAGEIIEIAKGRLAKVKCPRAVLFVSELPRNEHGKLLKRVLRDLLAADPGAAFPPVDLPPPA